MCEAINRLNKILEECEKFQDEYNKLVSELSYFDRMMVDIRHFIENEEESEITADMSYQYLTKQIQIFKKRRLMKNECQVYQKGINKINSVVKYIKELQSKSTNEWNKLKKLQQDKIYTPRVITKQEIFNIKE